MTDYSLNAPPHVAVINAINNVALAVCLSQLMRVVGTKVTSE